MVVPTHHASAAFVFTKLVNNTGFHNTSFYDTGTRRDHACNQPRQASPQAQAAGIG